MNRVVRGLNLAVGWLFGALSALTLLGMGIGAAELRTEPEDFFLPLAGFWIALLVCGASMAARWVWRNGRVGSGARTAVLAINGLAGLVSIPLVFIALRSEDSLTGAIGLLLLAVVVLMLLNCWDIARPWRNSP